MYSTIQTPAHFELRSIGGKTMIAGYAAVFDQPTSPRFADIYGFEERILAGAFGPALKSGQDIRALVEHDDKRILGRTGAGTLQVSQDARGLRFLIDPPDTQIGRDAAEMVRRGDYGGASFRFRNTVDRWAKEAGKLVRRIAEIRTLVEVTLTGAPAYPGTSTWLVPQQAGTGLQTAANRLRLAEAASGTQRSAWRQNNRERRLRLAAALNMPRVSLRMAKNRLRLAGAM